MASVLTQRKDIMWAPTHSEYKSLLWLLFPDEVGLDLPPCLDTTVPDDVDMSVLVAVSSGLFDELMWFSTASGLSVSEVIRRLLEWEVRQFGEFQVSDD